MSEVVGHQWHQLLGQLLAQFLSMANWHPANMGGKLLSQPLALACCGGCVLCSNRTSVAEAHLGEELLSALPEAAHASHGKAREEADQARLEQDWML